HSNKKRKRRQLSTELNQDKDNEMKESASHSYYTRSKAKDNQKKLRKQSVIEGNTCVSAISSTLLSYLPECIIRYHILLYLADVDVICGFCLTCKYLN